MHSLYKSSRPVYLCDFIFQNNIPSRKILNASDPRDLIFGLLDIISDKDDLDLYADYDMTVAEVFTRTTKSLFLTKNYRRRNYTLDCVVPVLETPADFPSWVPDWERIASRGLARYPINWHRRWYADRGMPDPANCETVEEDLYCLEKFSCVLGIITEIMQPAKLTDSYSLGEGDDPDQIIREAQERRREDIKARLSSIAEFAQLGGDCSADDDHVWRTVSFGKTCTGVNPQELGKSSLVGQISVLLRRIARNETIDAGALTPLQIEFIREAVSDMGSSEDILSSTQSCLKEVAETWCENIVVTLDRVLFKTTTGMLGLGYVSVKPRDVVTILHDVKSPIILRPSADAASAGRFSFAGDAYIDHVMQGEFHESKPEYQSFKIY